MRKTALLIPYALLALAVAVAAACLLVFESDLLWKVQELNLFSSNSDFFREQMVVPGGMLSWMGTFFTQFFYVPWMGVAFLCGWWLLLAFFTAKTFRIPQRWLVLLLIPVAFLLMAIVQSGYWIYVQKLRGDFFVPVIGFSLGILLVWIYRSLTSRYFLRSLFLVLTAFAAYPLMGAYGLLAVVLMVLICWRMPDMTVSRRLIDSVVGLLCCFAVPLLFYRYVYYQTDIDSIYMAALPIFSYEERYPSLYLPYVVCALFFAIVALAYGKWGTEKAVGENGAEKLEPIKAVGTKNSKRAKTASAASQKSSRKARRRAIAWYVAQVAVIAVLTWCVSARWYKDFNFHKELSMLRCAERGDWNALMAEAEIQKDEPTRSILMLRNLALFRLGRQGDEMYRYPSGSKKLSTPLAIRMNQISGKTIYFNYGQLNYCYRWCLEDGVEYGWKVEYLKYLTRCAMLNGERQVALKYIRLLKTTLFHREWAERHEQLLNDPKALKKDAEFEPVTHLLTSNDKLTSDNGLAEIFLNHQFMDVDVDTDDPLLQEQTLLSAIWMKDIGVFWPRYFKYLQLHQGQHVPTHYQEVAMLYGNLEHQVDISKLPFDESVVREYQNFSSRAQQYGGMSEESMKNLLKPEFGHTFYYEYFLNRDQEIY